MISKTVYPQDLQTKTAAEQELINQNRIATPIEVTSSKVKNTNPEEILSKVYNQYNDWGNNIIAPSVIQAAKANDILKDRITYHDYDNQGNPLEVSKADGSHIIYIWGYNNQYPIAKIANATYTGCL